MAGTVDPRIARILRKLEVIRGRGIETFGAKSHGFALAPPMTESAVAAVESTLGVELPDAFRIFLLQAGASGAAPYYGLLAAGQWSEHEPDDEHPRSITFADQGCAYACALVLEGEKRGRVMYINGDGGPPFFPDNPDFLSWYERWLDELSWGFEHFWFGTQIPGDEASFAALARSPTESQRNAALGAMFQLPALGPESREAVALRVRDTDPAVRTTALRLARSKGLVVEIEPHLRRALSDETPDVRESALEALAESALPWHDDARAALRDPDDAVASNAARLLRKANELRDVEIIALLARPGTRRTALEAARTQPSLALFDALITADPGTAEERNSGEPHINALNAHALSHLLDAPRRQQLLALLHARYADAGSQKLHYIVMVGFRALAPDEPAAFATLLGLLEHPDGYNRFDAANLLGDLGDADALPALRALTADDTMPRAESMSTAWSVGVAAQKAITKIEASLAKRS